MVENFPSNLFFFLKKRHVYCVKYLLHSKNFNYSSEKQILKNENILTETLNTSAKKKKIRSLMCVFLSLLKYFDLEMLPHRGFCQSNSRSHSPPRTGCPKSAASLVADMAEVLGAGPPLFREEILREGA